MERVDSVEVLRSYGGRLGPMSNPYEAPRSPVLPRTADEGKGKATASLVLGLFSTIGWIIPLIGLPTTIAGLVLGIKGLGPQRRGTAIAGIVLSIIFLVLSVLNMTWGAYLGATGQHTLLK
jgi:hypothetical protein